MSRRPNKKLVAALACAATGAVGLGTYGYFKVKKKNLISIK
jgi:hypothetical protein